MIPYEAAGLPLEALAPQFILIVGGSVLFNVFLTYACSGTSVARVIDGAPVWNYIQCCILQAFVFPILVLLSLSQYDDLASHTASTWHECSAKPGGCWMRTTLLVFVGYLVKDLNVCDTMTIIHHLAGLVFFICFLFTTGAHGFVTACVLLEFGNVFLNVSSLCKGRSTLHRLTSGLTVVAFTAVHIPAILLVYRVCSDRPAESSSVFYALVALTACLVVALRTHVVVGVYRAASYRASVRRMSESREQEVPELRKVQ